MEFLRLQTGVIEKIALKFSSGIRKEGVYGPQIFYTLMDGRGLYLDEPVAQKITNANIQPGQTFWLLKHKATGGGKHRRNLWDLYLEDPTPQHGESETERDLRLSIHQVKPKGNVTPMPTPAPDLSAGEPSRVEQASESRPKTQTAETHASKKGPQWADTLVQQTNCLVDAYSTCLDHASSKGVAVRPEDVRSLLVTAFIELSGRGKGRGAA